VGKNKGYHSAV